MYWQPPISGNLAASSEPAPFKLGELTASSTTADLKAALAKIDIPALRAAMTKAEAERAALLPTGSNSEVLAAEAKRKHELPDGGQPLRAAQKAGPTIDINFEVDGKPLHQGCGRN
jgi:hypothetical protein